MFLSNNFEEIRILDYEMDIPIFEASVKKFPCNYKDWQKFLSNLKVLTGFSPKKSIEIYSNIANNHFKSTQWVVARARTSSNQELSPAE